MRFTDNQINHLNTLLVVLSCAGAVLLPFHLLVFSYMILGPAHYLTQISWLHDRGYFCRSKHFSLAMIFVGALSFLLPYPIGLFMIFVALGLALFAVLNTETWYKTALFVLYILFGILAVKVGFYVLIAAAIIIPTALHVFGFTASFVLFGALKSKSISATMTMLAMIFCAAAFWFLPVSVYGVTTAIQHPGIEMFRDAIEKSLQSFDIALNKEAVLRIFGFLSFAYTYHYLNWFTKTRFIPWHQISRQRGVAIVALYLLFLGVYLYDYAVGFQFIVFLSFMHVLLEFPLNWRTFYGIGVELCRKTRWPLKA